MPEEYRYLCEFPLAEAKILPCPAIVNENGSFVYNELGTLAIKKELCAGRGVNIGLLGDGNTPGRITDPDNSYTKYTNLDGSEPQNGKADIWAAWVSARAELQQISMYTPQTFFTAEDDEYIRRIGIGTATPNCTVEYAVYLLNDDFSSPTDGVKAIESEVTFDYAGYHVIDLGKLVPVGKEQNYSIVARSLREDGKISVPVNADLNKNGYESLYEYRKSAHIEKTVPMRDLILK